MSGNSRARTVDSLFGSVAKTPAAQDLCRRVEAGGSVSLDRVAPAAQPFLAALLHHLFPDRPLLVVTGGLRQQESFHQDLQTWLAMQDRPGPLFFPAWEILPHEGKLPHADVISERLETLTGLAGARGTGRVVVTSAVALLQKTFSPGAIEGRTRRLEAGAAISPLDLVEWLEEQGYEPESQVNHKGEMSLRGGILDIFPMTSPWPVRLEFFGDELESLRSFDPVTQVSREAVESVVLPPGGELGILKRLAESGHAPAGPLLDHFPPGALVLLCDADLCRQQAGDYEAQLEGEPPLFIAAETLFSSLGAGGRVEINCSETGLPDDLPAPAVAPRL